MAYLKPQSPIQKIGGDYIYPLTTEDQVVIENARLVDYSLLEDKEVQKVLLASKWTKRNGQYVQTIVIDNLSESYNVDVKIAYIGNYDTDLKINKSASCIQYAKQNKDRITFYCLKNKPNINIPIELEVSV